jgi:transcriptional regulator with XRE-family HTH domain
MPEIEALPEVRVSLNLPVQMAGKKITGRTLASLLRVHVSSIVQWRTGNRMPSVERLAKVAVALSEATGGKESPQQVFASLVTIEVDE